MSEKTATETLAEMREKEMWIDRRRMRAEAITAAVLKVMEPYMRAETGRERRDAYYGLMELFHEQGV